MLYGVDNFTFSQSAYHRFMLVAYIPFIKTIFPKMLL